jgi:hypothetical protein
MLKINYLMLENMLCEYHQYLAVPFPVDNCSSLMKNIKNEELGHVLLTRTWRDACKSRERLFK